MRLSSRIEKLEAKAPTMNLPYKQIIGETQMDLDRQEAELRAEGFDGGIIAVMIVEPGDYEPAPGGGWQPTAAGLAKGMAYRA